MHIFGDKAVCRLKKVRIPFAAPSALHVAARLGLSSLLMDFTFKTNQQGLLLGAVGPVGIHVLDGLPHMRFMPTVFMISEAEDHEAHQTMLEIFLGLPGGEKYKDAFLDMACLQGAEAQVGDAMYLHRCLQHTKKDIKEAASKKDDNTGKVRLQRAELGPRIIQSVEFSAWLPDDLEF